MTNDETLDINQIRALLSPHEGNYVAFGLSQDKIDQLERKVGQSFPPYYRAYLGLLGLKQDVIFGLLERETDFIPLDDFLPPEQGMRFFRIGDNGGEEDWLLRSDKPSDSQI